MRVPTQQVDTKRPFKEALPGHKENRGEVDLNLPCKDGHCRPTKWLKWSEVSAEEGSKRPERTVKSATCNWGRWEPRQSRTTFALTWCAKIAMPTMDVGIHSDKEHGVTGLG